MQEEFDWKQAKLARSGKRYQALFADGLISAFLFFVTNANKTPIKTIVCQKHQGSEFRCLKGGCPSFLIFRALNIFLSILCILLIACVSVICMARAPMQAYSDGFYGEGSLLFDSSFLDVIIRPLFGAIYIVVFVGVTLFSNHINNFRTTFWVLLANNLSQIIFLSSIIMIIMTQQL